MNGKNPPLQNDLQEMFPDWKEIEPGLWSAVTDTVRHP